MKAGTNAFASAVSAVLLSSSAIAMGSPGTAEPDDVALSEQLKAHTQAFSEAGLAGDAATLGKYLDEKVVFTNETGEIVTKKDIVEGALAVAGQPHIEVTEWHLTRQGDVASSTFVDVLTQRSGSQTLTYRYHSTEVWAERPSGWRMIASQTMVVPVDPPAIILPPAQLDEYLGLYQAKPSVQVRITKSGEGLVSSTNGGPPRPLSVEMRDVLFTPGTAPGLRLFQRDGTGRITGYIARKNGNDMVVQKIS